MEKSWLVFEFYDSVRSNTYYGNVDHCPLEENAVVDAIAYFAAADSCQHLVDHGAVVGRSFD